MPLSRRCPMIFAYLPALLLPLRVCGQDEVPKPPPPSNVPTLEFRARRTFKTDGRPLSVSLSADGRFLAAKDHLASGGSWARVWDTRSGEAVARLDANALWIGQMRLSPDGTTLAFTRYRLRGIYDIQLLDLAQGKVVRTLSEQKHRIDEMAFSPDGKLLASLADDDGVKLWDVVTGKDLDRFSAYRDNFHSGGGLKFAPDGKTLAVTAADGGGVVHLLDVAKGEEVRRMRPPHRLPAARALAFSPDGRLLAVGSWGETAVLVWDPRNGRLVWQLTWERGREDRNPLLHELGLNPGTASLVFSADGRCLVAGCCDMYVRAWETASGGLRYEVEEYLLSFGRVGRLFAGVVRRQQLCLWEAHDRRPAASPDADKAWSGLADRDAAATYTLMRNLIAVPRIAVVALDKRLPTAKPVEAASIDRMVRDLDDDAFEVRDKASRALSGLGEVARPALVSALAKKPSAEARRSIKQLLDVLDGPADEARLRLLRAVEVLESIGTPEARRVLKRLASGESKALITREAKAALARLEQR